MMGWSRLSIGLFLALVFAVAVRSAGAAAGVVKGRYYGVPDNCKRLECPSYAVVHSQVEFEIRKYQSALWMSTPLLNSSSYDEDAARGFNMYAITPISSSPPPS